MARRPFRLIVSDLLHEPGHRRPVEIEAAVNWALESSRVDPKAPLRAELTLEGVVGGVYARGQVVATVRHTCKRCLREWAEPLEVAVGEVIGTDPEAEYRVEGHQADLEPPLRDAVLLALPLLPVCRPDCRGLCAACGADLNTNPCWGHDEEPESPFTALRHLLEP